jgi:alkylation response protein AidB-like acyl-CoA dehydrogenase
LPGLCDGTLIGANAASEPEAGSDVFAMRTGARKAGAGWVLDGRKTWCTNAPVADLFVCYAATDPAKGVLGISAFLVPRRTPGPPRRARDPQARPADRADGRAGAGGLHAAPEALLGREGRGAEVFHGSMEWERGAILAAALGTMRRQLERCQEHARRRRQFGRPIGQFQAVAHRIVDMAVRLETCRPLVYKVGWLKARGEDATLAAAMAKLHVSECFVQNSLDAVRSSAPPGTPRRPAWGATCATASAA